MARLGNAHPLCTWTLRQIKRKRERREMDTLCIGFSAFGLGKCTVSFFYQKEDHWKAKDLSADIDLVSKFTHKNSLNILFIKNEDQWEKSCHCFVDIRKVHEKWSIFCFYSKFWIVVVLEKIVFENLNSCTCFLCNIQTFLNFSSNIFIKWTS
jgi:hypothetical protein